MNPKIRSSILSNSKSFWLDLDTNSIEKRLLKSKKRPLLNNIDLKENSFTIEVEITMKLAKKKIKFYEVGIGYNGRTYEEGKKISIRDGFIALYKILYYKFFK